MGTLALGKAIRSFEQLAIPVTRCHYFGPNLGIKEQLYCPVLLRHGAFIREATRWAALKQIEQVVQQIVMGLIDVGASIPEDILVADSALVSVTAEW